MPNKERTLEAVQKEMEPLIAEARTLRQAAILALPLADLISQIEQALVGAPEQISPELTPQERTAWALHNNLSMFAVQLDQARAGEDSVARPPSFSALEKS